MKPLESKPWELLEPQPNPPRRTIETRWGQLDVVAPSADQVRLTTYGEEQDSELVFNGIGYGCSVTVHRSLGEGTAERWPYHVVELNETWQVEVDAVAHGLTRPEGPVTAAAMASFRDKLLPRVAEWLESPDGRALVAESARHKRSGLYQAISTAESYLADELATVRAAKAELDTVGDLTPAHWAVIERTNQAAQQAARPAGAHTQPPRPEPGGLGL